MTTLLVLAVLVVLLYRRVLHLWENQRPGAALLTGLVLAAAGTAATGELAVLLWRALGKVTTTG